MQRVKYDGTEYLLPTRSGTHVIQVLREAGAAVNCPGGARCDGSCALEFPKDGQWLLVPVNGLEEKLLDAEQLAKGWRLACQAWFR